MMVGKLSQIWFLSCYMKDRNSDMNIQLNYAEVSYWSLYVTAIKEMNIHSSRIEYWIDAMIWKENILIQTAEFNHLWRNGGVRDQLKRAHLHDDVRIYIQSPFMSSVGAKCQPTFLLSSAPDVYTYTTKWKLILLLHHLNVLIVLEMRIHKLIRLAVIMSKW